MSFNAALNIGFDPNDRVVKQRSIKLPRNQKTHEDARVQEKTILAARLIIGLFAWLHGTGVLILTL